MCECDGMCPISNLRGQLKYLEPSYSGDIKLTPDELRALLVNTRKFVPFCEQRSELIKAIRQAEAKIGHAALED